MSFQDYAKQMNAQMVRGECSTLYIFTGLDKMSEVLAEFKKSPEYSKMLDVAFKNYKLAIAVAD